MIQSKMKTTVCRDYIGIVENRLEATFLGFRVGLRLSVQVET